jgi:hypothetical protein
MWSSNSILIRELGRTICGNFANFGKFGVQSGSYNYQQLGVVEKSEEEAGKHIGPW